ncbi:hypothetical protein [Bradyrhizobium centrosematis]|uniref:hypothetical protein n=1 Tax=Bradyrhizobium centrosematis TaxID=1300039 RepID=UPI0038906B56
MEPIKSLIARVVAGATLTCEKAKSAFDRKMSGYATPSQMEGIFIAMKVRGRGLKKSTAPHPQFAIFAEGGSTMCRDRNP